MNNTKDERLTLISIMTYYADQIFNKTKQFEFRKSPLKESDLNKPIYVYSAKGHKAIIGTMEVSKIHKGSVEEILKITGYDKRLDGKEIVDYFAGKDVAYALEISNVKKFSKPLTLKEMRKVDPHLQLPQYYTYIKRTSPLYEQIKKIR